MRFDDTPLHSSRLLEAMRAFPARLVHVVIVTQALAWLAAMLIVPSSPPYEVIAAAVVGREGLLGTGTHPPLAAWLLGALDHLSGGHLRLIIVAGVALKALALWATFGLARALFGDRQGAFAVLLLSGVWWVMWTPPVFDPDHLLLALYPLTTWTLWQAINTRHKISWMATASGLALMVMAKYVAVMLVAALFLALLGSARGRAALRTADPWGALIMAAALLTPHLAWLANVESGEVAYALSYMGIVPPERGAMAWAIALAQALLGHLGLAALAVLAVLPRGKERANVPVFPREPLDDAARRFVLVIALAPVVLFATAGIALRTPVNTAWLTPLFPFSGVLTVMLLGDAIPLFRQVLVGRVLTAFVLGAPLVFALGAQVDPWFGAGARDDNWPSAAIGHWFTDVYRIRTGKPLTVVAGDTWTAGTLALASPDRPTVFIDADEKRAPWISPEMLHNTEILVVWRAIGGERAPPEHLRARFPGLVVEEPHAFPWTFPGRLSPVRIGWGIARP